MSSLASVYALSCGVPLDRPQINDTFFPLETPLDKVILLHAFAGQIVEQNGQKIPAFAAKCYSHFNETLSLLSPILAPLGYRFYQIGGPNEPPVRGAEYLCGKTTIAQCAYLVKRAALLIANDSMWVHARGAEGKSLVALYGATDDKNHGPHWRDPVKTAIIESHRSGRKPSYAMQENPRTIDYITPESVASGALHLLSISDTLTHHTHYIGPEYQLATFEIVPNMVVPPQTNLGAPPSVRMDFEFNEQILAQNLSVRKCSVVTDKEINLNLLAQFKPQIHGLRIEVDKLSADWIKKVRRLGIPIQAVCDEKDPEKVSAMRLALYDACLFDTVQEPTIEDLKREMSVYLNKELDKDFNFANLSFKSNRFILSSGKIYLSTAHWRAGRSVESTDKNTEKVIDTSEFWAEQKSHYYFFT